jgi:PIN domain nuclease of toxin-antitoxin system
VLAEERGRLELPCAAEEWFRDALEPMDIILLPLNAQIACRAVGLSAVHKDPFVRVAYRR